MGLCEELENWDSKTDEEREAFLEDFINDYLQEQGHEPVDVVRGDIDSEYAEWDKDHNTVVLNDETIGEWSADEGIDTGLHEATHAEKDFEGGHADDMDEDDVFEKYTVIFNDDGSTTLYDPGTPTSAEHREIYEFAAAVTDMIMDACDEEPESAAEKDLPPGDWVVPSGDTAYA